ncbi:uncharacterized protein SCODWIG_03179 [Saccharomycodes ludwigii]|uniref:Programmed cell death protein 5 n=1 Tax=Saccharomycodes ludwigii TaxID=36035 RepID=A0A376B9Q1_9ASCO|nr:hypothetical protein SCDLUD_005266 [Saccharomycodes ludwigii]KAH3898921.1 hypothetical protein SCDLUD_005266 [Saccharomycodes ludwigii]SSD61418.1 uncharacterized protein SCODWIG_03179 [Saccharomycodes ludwigii]
MDSDLEAIRQARLQQLKNNEGGGNSSESSSFKPVGEHIAQFLEPKALERLSRISMVRPERAKQVEQYLTMLIQRGALRNKVSEQDLVQILDGITRNENTTKKQTAKIIFNRREEDGDEDEDLLFTSNAANTSNKKNNQENEDSDDDFFD